MSKVIQRWPRPWGATRPPQPAGARAASSPARDLLAQAGPIPDDQAHELASQLIATAINRGYAGACELADAFAAARIPLRLANWPTPALRPLEVSP